MPETRAGATIPEVIHHRAPLNDRTLHYVTAGTDGTPILLVHGFPESWWAFHKLIPLIAGEHRVIAVDLPGFGDSGHEPGDYTSSFAAESLRQLVEHLELGPVHLTGQDIGGVSTFRLETSDPTVNATAAIDIYLGYSTSPAITCTTWPCTKTIVSTLGGTTTVTAELAYPPDPGDTAQPPIASATTTTGRTRTGTGGSGKPCTTITCSKT